MRKTQRGMSLAEVLVGLMILSVMILTTATATTTALKLSRNNINKEFATQKAISMLEELRALVQVQVGTRVTVLDAYDDGVKNKYILTTQGQLPTLVTQPEDPISGNSRLSSTQWRYERRISVQPVPGQGNDVRFVNVKVYINEDKGQRLVAEVASVIRTLVVDMPPTQVYDVYAVAIENVPGWWVYMSNIVPFVRSTISDLQARNPGLVFRMHWIYTLSYGRDWQYKPYINNASSSTNDINYAYFYPGQMPPNGVGMPVGNPFYYPWFLFRGLMNKDGVEANGYVAPTTTPVISKGNPWPYPIADQFNNSMRYEDELAYYNKRLSADPDEEPTWRLLIEQMYSNPQKFTNAIVINLHGELLPFPPVRNYSDAAKSPESYPNIRAVTHPEQLRYTNNDNVKLRVYTYRTDPDNAAANTSYMGEGGANDVPVTIKIKGMAATWTPAAGDIQFFRGGTNQDGIAGLDAYDATAQNATTTVNATGMYYTVTPSGTDTILKLYHSPLKHAQVSGQGGGLDPNSRLYGLEYIPSPLEDLTQTTTANQFTLRHIGSTDGKLINAFRDSFTGTAFNNSDGTLAWSTIWDETNDGTDNATTGRIRFSGGKLLIGDDGTTGASTIERGANLSGYATARLNFDYTTTAAESGDDMRVEVSSTGVGGWVTLATYSGGSSQLSGAATFDLGAYLTSTMRIRFIRLNGYTVSDEFFNVDNLQIEVTKSGMGEFPKNTARWIITIPSNQLTCVANPVGSPCGKLLTIETRLGVDMASGVMYPPADVNVPPNLSKTYVWRGEDSWIFGDGTNAHPPHLPITEMFQFLGDPRHLPYADLKRPHVGSGFGTNFENRLGMGYNRYFDDLEAGANVDANNDGFADGNVATAEILARNVQNYTISANNTKFSVKVNGTTVSVTLGTGGQTAAAIATTLNASSAFNAVAVASSFATTLPPPTPTPLPSGTTPTQTTTTRLRIRAKDVAIAGGAASISHASSIEYDNAVGTNGSIFAFEGELAYGNTTGAVPWPGWRYTGSDGNLYGVRNDDTMGNATWNNMEIDVHRAFQMLRSALISSNALWTTMTGYSYYYMGIGNEIGYDAANTFPNSIPISTMPYTGVTGSNWEQTIIDANGQGCTLGCGVKYIRQQDTWTGWWSLSWIGEIYPDSQYAADSNWKVNGNLRAGSGSTYYVRSPREWMPRYSGTDLVRAERRTGPRGSTTLFWGESANSAFHHTGSSGTATILDDGRDIRNNYSLPVPDTIPNDRPWQIAWNATGDNPHQFLTGGYPTPRYSQLLQRYFQRIIVGTEPSEASALVAMTDPSNGKPAFIVVNGLSPTGITGTTFIAKWSFLTLIQSYLNGGKFVDAKVYTDPDAGGPLQAPVPGSTYHVRQLPRVEITLPNINTEIKNPDKVRVEWAEKWTRWDGKRYSSAYTADCQNTVQGCYTPAVTYTRKYIVLYSPNNGTPDAASGNPTGWFYTDGTPGTLGGRNLTAHGVSDMYAEILTPEDKFPEGNYLIRVEDYRENYPQHYAFHQYRAYLQRQ